MYKQRKLKIMVPNYFKNEGIFITFYKESQQFNFTNLCKMYFHLQNVTVGKTSSIEKIYNLIMQKVLRRLFGFKVFISN